ncbi:hypothetical protein HN873_050084 [Arachis hypogaea]
MEKKMNHKSKSIQDILPLDLIHRILLRVPVRHLASLKCVSKRWYSLISDPLFAELHFHHSPAATKASVFMGGGSLAYFVYLDSLFTDNNDALQVKKVSLPFKMKKLPSDFEFLGSCRGFVLLHRDPHFLVVWNPLTGSGKRISYSHIVSRFKHKGFRLPCKFHLYGFGYDASQDDYLVFVAWQDKDDHYHFDCFSLRTNSWINLDAALSKPLDVCHRNSCGLFLNGAIHWVPYSLTTYRDAIIIFDMKERTFSRISGPEQPVMSACTFPTLALLGGCLALYYCNNDSCNTHIWVMKEYKVLSSWTLYQIPCKDFRPLCLSSNMDIIGRGYTLCGTVGYFIYNVREDLLKHFNDRYCWLPLRTIDPVYTESLLPLPDDIKEKDKKKNMKKSERQSSNSGLRRDNLQNFFMSMECMSFSVQISNSLSALLSDMQRSRRRSWIRQTDRLPLLLFLATNTKLRSTSSFRYSLAISSSFPADDVPDFGGWINPLAIHS